MRLLKQEMIGAKLAEVRIQYRTDSWEEDVILDALNVALDGIRAAGVKFEDYTEEDRRRFEGI